MAKRKARYRANLSNAAKRFVWTMRAPASKRDVDVSKKHSVAEPAGVGSGSPGRGCRPLALGNLTRGA
jgi:hypothetical protein